MAFNSIRTKIIGGYLLFVFFILSVLGLNYILVASTLKKSESVYKSSEWIREEMTAENVFWRQAIAITDYFLTGEDEYKVEFKNYQKTFEAKSNKLEAASKGASEQLALSQLRDRYQVFVTKFDRASALYRAGRIAEARQMDLAEIDPIEEEIEIVLENLLELRNGDINNVLSEIRAYRRYSNVVPSLVSMINSTEEIRTESLALQQTLESEEHFLKQVLALTEFFTFDEKEQIDEFHKLGENFRNELSNEHLFTESPEEVQQLAVIAAKHVAFTDEFTSAVEIYQSGDRARAPSPSRRR